MGNEEKKRAIEKTAEDGVVQIGDTVEPISRVYEVFKSLSDDEQEEMLRLILTEGGVTKLFSLAQSVSTPGAMDLVLDRISYYHFLRPVTEEIPK